jgi:hypothetical protein
LLSSKLFEEDAEGFLLGYTEGTDAAVMIYRGILQEAEEFPHLYADPEGQTKHAKAYKAGFWLSVHFNSLILKGALNERAEQEQSSGRTFSRVRSSSSKSWKNTGRAVASENGDS